MKSFPNAFNFHLSCPAGFAGVLHSRLCHLAYGIAQKNSPWPPLSADVCQLQVKWHCPGVICPKDEGHFRTLNGPSPGPALQLHWLHCRGLLIPSNMSCRCICHGPGHPQKVKWHPLTSNSPPGPARHSGRGPFVAVLPEALRPPCHPSTPVHPPVSKGVGSLTIWALIWRTELHNCIYNWDCFKLGLVPAHIHQNVPYSNM